MYVYARACFGRFRSCLSRLGLHNTSCDLCQAVVICGLDGWTPDRERQHGLAGDRVA